MVQFIYTIGHSSHDIETFFSHLKRYNITDITDIRRSPRSSRFPHFNREQIESECLARSSFNYSFYGDILGARRRRRQSFDQLNNALVDPDARSYADHMQTIEFQQIISQLISNLSSSSALVLMCSENNPEFCHRSLLADYLTLIHRIQVIHILFHGETCNHQLHVHATFHHEYQTCIYPNGFETTTIDESVRSF